MARKLPDALKQHQFKKGGKKEAPKAKPRAKATAKKPEGGFGRQGPGPQIRV